MPAISDRASTRALRVLGAASVLSRCRPVFCNFIFEEKRMLTSELTTRRILPPEELRRRQRCATEALARSNQLEGGSL